VSEAKRLTSGWDKKMGLSLSADGKHLAFLRWRGEAHVYVSGIEPGLRRLDAPQRLSLDEGKNFPYAWTPDGKSVLFISDRGGQARLFKQSIDQAAPDLLVSGDDPPLIARLSPDGSEVFYLQRAHAKDGGKMQLMRMPLSGGTPQMILQREIIDNFQCARLPSTTCIFGQASANELRFFSFDPNTGKETQLTQTTLNSGARASTSARDSTPVHARRPLSHSGAKRRRGNREHRLGSRRPDVVGQLVHIQRHARPDEYRPSRQSKTHASRRRQRCRLGDSLTRRAAAGILGGQRKFQRLAAAGFLKSGLALARERPDPSSCDCGGLHLSRQFRAIRNPLDQLAAGGFVVDDHGSVLHTWRSFSIPVATGPAPSPSIIAGYQRPMLRASGGASISFAL
jgi:hypothetical protein